MRLQESSQYPPTSPFAFEDLQWTQQVLFGNGCYIINYVVIPWERLYDYIVGEQDNDIFLCKFTKKIVKKNLPNSLSNQRANNPSIATIYCHPLQFFSLAISQINAPSPIQSNACM